MLPPAPTPPPQPTNDVPVVVEDPAPVPDPAPDPPPVVVEPTPASTDQVKRAVCIGWNRVDPAAYNGWSGDLEDCEFDASFAGEMWRENEVLTRVLLTAHATRDACRAALRDSLDGMRAGDMLIVWVSGHGGQGPDATGEGADNLGEYVCAYDGPVKDNTINEWLRLASERVPGIRILWICDTCHSGTMFKRPPVNFRPEAIPAMFDGELILLAGCAEDAYSLSTGQGGMWSTALHDTGPHGQSPASWFAAAKALVPGDQQVPVYAEYGAVSDAFRNGVILPAATPDPEPEPPQWPTLTAEPQPWPLEPYKVVGMLAVPGQGLFVTCANVYRNGFRSTIFRNGVRIYEGNQETIGQPSLVDGLVYFPVEHGASVLYWYPVTGQIMGGSPTHGKWSVALGSGLVAYNNRLGGNAVFQDCATVYDVLSDQPVWTLPVPGMPRSFFVWMDTTWTTINFGGNAICSRAGNIYTSPALHALPFHGNVYGGGGVETGPAFGKDGRVYGFDLPAGTWATLHDTGATSCQQIIEWRGLLLFLFNNPDTVLAMDQAGEFRVLYAWPPEPNPDKRDFGIAAADWNGDLWVGRTDGGSAELYRMRIK